MSQDAELMLESAMHDMRHKYIYFLLTATGACIGFAVTQTKGSQLSHLMWPLAVAVASWAISFFCGCRSLAWKPEALAANIALLKLRDGKGERYSRNPLVVVAATTSHEEGMVKAADKFSFHARLQFWCFILASIAFLLWHVLEMWARQALVT